MSKAKIWLTPEAYIKMNTLVQGYSTEVGWHGLVERVADNQYCVYDILVYPHFVSPATIISDDINYSEWLMNLSDEDFDALRFHGHSHVFMSPTPSGVDYQFRKDLLSQTPEESDTFYIFFIINKRSNWTAQIYDYKTKQTYNTDDIEVAICFSDGSSRSRWLKDSKKIAVRRSSSEFNKITRLF